MGNEANKSRIFLLRLNERLKRSLEENIVGIGWSNATQLIAIDKWPDFKSHIRAAYPNYEGNERSLGNAAGSIWRFLKVMEAGSRIVVPVPKGFYVAEVLEDKAYYEPNGVAEDYAYRRRVKWLKKEPRSHPTNLRSRIMQQASMRKDV